MCAIGFVLLQTLLMELLHVLVQGMAKAAAPARDFKGAILQKAKDTGGDQQHVYALCNC